MNPSAQSWADETAATAPAAGQPMLDEEELEVEVKLSDLQAQEGNPLHSITTFDELGLSPEIRAGITDMGFRSPSKIQERALPLLLSDPPRNMIAQSQSGTGKTAAFVITILSRVDFNRPIPQALVLSPSRELARQIEGVIKMLGRNITNLSTQAAIPGAVERGRSIEAAIVVGTPGTVMDLVKRRQLDSREMKVIVLDEADNMLDQQGLGEQCVRVKGMLPRTIQTLLFSATFPEKVMSYAQKFAPSAVELTLPQRDLTVKGISQMYMDCPGDEGKYEYLCKLYGLMQVASSIIFVKKRSTADEIQKRMELEGHSVAVLHGAYEGQDRDAVIDRFRNGEAKVLITTNVLARGIDVQTVSMVINYDIPMKGRYDDEPDMETYLHRIGRTGRFGKVGVSISFVFDKKSFHALEQIVHFYGIDLVKLPSDDWDECERIIMAITSSSRAGANFKNS